MHSHFAITELREIGKTGLILLFQMRKWTLREEKHKPRSKNELAMEFKILTLASPSGVGGCPSTWDGALFQRSLCSSFGAQSLVMGYDTGFILGAQAGHLSSKVTGLAKPQALRLLWKQRCKGLPGLLAAWLPHWE